MPFLIGDGDTVFTMRLIVVTLLMLFSSCQAERSKRGGAPYYGIPVPGRTVSALDVFRLFGGSCRPRSGSRGQEHNVVEDIAKLLANPQGQEMAQNYHNALYFALGDVDVTKLMGKWYTVVDSPSVHLEQCVVSYFQLIQKAQYTATFAVRQYFRTGNGVELMEGYGTQVGPDPGQLFISTGHPSDPCPYTPIKVGQLNSRGQYEYVIVSQFLKHPTMVLARDPQRFEAKFRKEVEQFVDKFDFRKPLSGANNALRFINFTDCPTNEYFFDLSYDM